MAAWLPEAVDLRNWVREDPVDDGGFLDYSRLYAGLGPSFARPPYDHHHAGSLELRADKANYGRGIFQTNW